MKRLPILPWLVVLGVMFVMFATWPGHASNVEFYLGHHIHSPAHDPYAQAVDQEQRDCCKGGDCVPFLDAPEKNADGSWQFGPWRVTADKLIKIETLHRSVRGIHSICFGGGRAGAIAYGAGVHVRCAYPAQSGT